MPVVDRVPLMVWRESNVTWVTPAAEGAVMVRLLKVFMLLILCVEALVAVKDKL